MLIMKSCLILKTWVFVHHETNSWIHHWLQEIYNNILFMLQSSDCFPIYDIHFIQIQNLGCIKLKSRLSLSKECSSSFFRFQNIVYPLTHFQVLLVWLYIRHTLSFMFPDAFDDIYISRQVQEKWKRIYVF